MGTIIGLVKALLLIIAILVVYNFFSDGRAGVVGYLESIDTKLVLVLILTLAAVLAFFSVLAVCAINFIASIKYCRKNGLNLKSFYSLTKDEILDAWGYKH